MKDILQYFDTITGIIEHGAVESLDVAYDSRAMTLGNVSGVLYLQDGSRLEFRELVAIRNRRPAKPRYRYQYVRAGEALFRYDNVGHHPGVSSHPHHKHVGRHILPATEPSLAQVLEEAVRLMQESRNGKPRPAKRRRQTTRKK
jgi:hypothetical protein